MSETETRGKTVCFIDDSNIFHGQLDSGWRIDWQKFQDYLQQKGPVWQTYFFTSDFHPEQELKESGFLHFLKDTLRWEVRIYELGQKTLDCKSCGTSKVVPTEKGVDVGVATHMLMLAMNRAYDTAVLVAGDRDYAETVRFVKGLGLRVEVVSWKSSLSNELSEESSAPVILLDELRDTLQKKQR